MKLTNPRLFSERAFVGGEWILADDQRTLTVANPSTCQAVGTIPRLGRTETNRAISAAAAAFPAWSRRPAHERSHVLRSWANLMHAHREDLAVVMTLEQGKPL